MAKPKILFTASIAKHILRFHLPYLQWFQQQGYETHVACEGDEKIPFTDYQWRIPFIRSPFAPGHFKSYKQLKKLIDKENYVLVHCHTPMTSLITRLAARKSRKKGTKVIYTAHGFHFYKGASVQNWLTYYPIELLASRFADAIVTINTEDYNLIRKKGFAGTQYFLIPGIGVNGEKFTPVTHEEKINLRISKGYTHDDLLLVYAAEFIDRKNHKFIIDSVPQILKQTKNVKFLFCGRGVLKQDMELLVHDMNITNNVHFLGFREDIDEIYKMADIGVSSSKQEGLGLNLVEEMMCGLPILATVDRGHKEIVVHGENGFIFKQGDQDEFIGYFMKLYNDELLRERLGLNSIKIAANFELKKSLEVMVSIYKKILT